MGNHSFQRESEAVERAFDEASLTDREKDAARSLLQGMTAQEAADIMGVSPSSVGSYRTRAYEKLGVGSGRELVSLHRAWPVAEVNADVNEKLRVRGLNETQASDGELWESALGDSRRSSHCSCRGDCSAAGDGAICFKRTRRFFGCSSGD